MILYHATFGKFIPTIKTEGLLSKVDGNKGDNWGWGTEFTDEIFLSDDKDIAASYCECADNVDDATFDSGIYIVEVEVDEENVDEDRWSGAPSCFVHHGPVYPDRFLKIWRYDG